VILKKEPLSISLTTDCQKKDGRKAPCQWVVTGTETRKTQTVAFNEQKNAVASALSILIRNMICSGKIFAALCTTKESEHTLGNCPGLKVNVIATHNSAFTR